MAYSRTTWENSPSTATPISAALLNNMEQGIVDVDGSISSISGSVTSISGSVTSLAGSVSTISGSVNNTAGSVIALAGTAGTAYNLTSTYGSVVSTQGSVANIAGTAGTAYNLTSTYGSVSSHVSATTSVHGITDTANLVYTNNATLGSVATINASLGSVAGTVSTNTSNISIISGSVTAINSSLGSVAGTVSMGGLVFTNEAARDAAITSPTEGMRAYLTAPTVPAISGTGTLPTGITTIYNGTSWVCVTPVCSGNTGASGTIATGNTYASTLTGDTTAISVTITTGTTALVTMYARAYSASALSYMSLAVGVSGATTVAAVLANGLRSVTAGAVTDICLSRTFCITGLNSGSNTFTLNYYSFGSTGTFFERSLVVQGIA